MIRVRVTVGLLWSRTRLAFFQKGVHLGGGILEADLTEALFSKGASIVNCEVQQTQALFHSWTQDK